MFGLVLRENPVVLLGFNPCLIVCPKSKQVGDNGWVL